MPTPAYDFRPRRQSIAITVPICWPRCKRKSRPSNHSSHPTFPSRQRMGKSIMRPKGNHAIAARAQSGKKANGIRPPPSKEAAMRTRIHRLHTLSAQKATISTAPDRKKHRVAEAHKAASPCRIKRGKPRGLAEAEGVTQEDQSQSTKIDGGFGQIGGVLDAEVGNRIQEITAEAAIVDFRGKARHLLHVAHPFHQRNEQIVKHDAAEGISAQGFRPARMEDRFPQEIRDADLADQGAQETDPELGPVGYQPLQIVDVEAPSDHGEMSLPRTASITVPISSSSMLRSATG